MKDLTGETVEPDFDAFWAVYPRLVGKTAAKKAWAKAVEKLKMRPTDIVEGARRYAAAKRGTDKQYIAHAATWINAQRWLDDDETNAQSEERPHTVDSKAVQDMENNKEIQIEKRRLIERTREFHAASLHEAARRLGATEPELWDCMHSGLDGFERRAWLTTARCIVLQLPIPGALPIEREHWISGKERYETRARMMASRPYELSAETIVRMQKDA